MKIGLTMRTLIRWEQLTGKSFNRMDYSDEKDFSALLYCAVLCCNPDGRMYTLDEFKRVMANEKLTKQMADALAREASVMDQFRQKEETQGESGTQDASDTIGENITKLIMGGLDARFAMDDMSLCDIPLFAKAYGQRIKEEMESSRQWTYLGMLPHINASKLKHGAQDIYPFPWEMEERKKEADRAIKEDAEKMELFFKEGKKLIEQNYGK